MRHFDATILLLFMAITGEAVRRTKRGTLPDGHIPHECCKVFCPPRDVCVCCFVDYEYHDGIAVKRVNGVPEWLLAQNNQSSNDSRTMSNNSTFDVEELADVNKHTFVPATGFVKAAPETVFGSLTISVVCIVLQRVLL